jgi:HEPN domain-containing protein
MPRTFSAKDGVVAVDLLHCGVDHLDAAKTLFGGNPSHFDSAGYLAHIGTELLLKAWLLHSTGQFEGIHNCKDLFEMLVKQCGATSPTEENLAALTLLDQHESLRYPNRNAPTEVGTEQWNLIEAFVGYVCRSMPKELSEELGKVKAGSKSGRVLMRKKIDHDVR